MIVPGITINIHCCAELWQCDLRPHPVLRPFVNLSADVGFAGSSGDLGRMMGVPLEDVLLE